MRHLPTRGSIPPRRLLGWYSISIIWHNLATFTIRAAAIEDAVGELWRAASRRACQKLHRGGGSLDGQGGYLDE
jgi:hypothetical protein